MLIIHDLPESTFGDIPAFVKDTDTAAHAEHKKREKQAASDLYHLLPIPVGDELTALQEEFEKGESKEARVAQALEKIESQLQHLESGPKYWGEEEKGEHMLHYPDKVLHKLNNKHIDAIWNIIYKDIYDLTYPKEN